ncbi:DNA alkylation repair enzyme [Elusimicrobium minutum Pei191]|uniref:DNA alkylation repair enzyme n=1 Tax=Elusimicrobium minutum (strain Pei191) TaxID=445932 RepID=B2KB53_ELUMP|nr:DNA alkylation repair protein [Elusimicrobium minutum]ACC97812.1 DNA alkylation repair enzyme [Elusimicrobium minutum Pei191]
MSVKNKILNDLKKISDKGKAVHLSRFFKTGKGQYGEGDIFIGVIVPDNRKIAKKYFKEISLAETEELLRSPVHEHRLNALIILRLKFEWEEEKEKEKIVKLYLKNTKNINNWDLVDLSACYILGPWYYKNKNYSQIYKMARSGFLWEERIAMLTTFYFIREKDFNLTLELAEYFLTHEHDLMHKACGWMLREMGKRDIKPLLVFLDKHGAKMPRTMLRYAIEKLPQHIRKKYLAR